MISLVVEMSTWHVELRGDFYDESRLHEKKRVKERLLDTRLAREKCTKYRCRHDIKYRRGISLSV